MLSCSKEKHTYPKCGITFETKEKLMEYKKKEHM
jgi:hypothetical protein